MKLEELNHVLRASAAIADEKSMVVVGSQAVLLLLEEPPEALLVSREVDLYPALHPERADLIDGAIGMHSSFHETFGYFADGVGPETAVVCPDLHDLTVSKCVAGRDKDAEFVRVLFKHGLVSASLLKERIAMLDGAKYPLSRIGEWVERRQIESKSRP